MSTIGRATAVILVLALLPCCTLAKISGRGTKPLILNGPAAEAYEVGQLNVNKMVTFDYTSSFDVSEIARNEIAKANADAVANVVITVKGDVATFFLNVFTLGFANAKRFHVTGDLVKFGQASTPPPVPERGSE